MKDSRRAGRYGTWLMFSLLLAATFPSVRVAAQADSGSLLSAIGTLLNTTQLQQLLSSLPSLSLNATQAALDAAAAAAASALPPVIQVPTCKTYRSRVPVSKVSLARPESATFDMSVS